MERSKAGQQASSDSGSGIQQVASAHHISSIAHLFFDESENNTFDESSPSAQRIMVFSAGPSPVAAVATAGLCMGSSGSAYGGRVVLRENTGLKWSSQSFLEKSSLHLLGPAGTGENGGDGDDHGSAWLVNPLPDTHSIKSPIAIPRRTVRWIHGGCADDSALLEMETIAGSRKWGRGINGSVHGLVWCLLEKEAGALVAAYQLGRLVSLLQPKQVEILIFPDSWSKTGKPLWQRKLFQKRNNSPSHQQLLVSRCRELASFVGECQVSIMPESLVQNHDQAGSSSGALQDVASRMLVAE